MLLLFSSLSPAIYSPVKRTTRISYRRHGTTLTYPLPQDGEHELFVCLSLRDALFRVAEIVPRSLELDPNSRISDLVEPNCRCTHFLTSSLSLSSIRFHSVLVSLSSVLPPSLSLSLSICLLPLLLGFSRILFSLVFDSPFVSYVARNKSQSPQSETRPVLDHIHTTLVNSLTACSALFLALVSNVSYVST